MLGFYLTRYTTLHCRRFISKTLRWLVGLKVKARVFTRAQRANSVGQRYDQQFAGCLNTTLNSEGLL